MFLLQIGTKRRNNMRVIGVRDLKDNPTRALRAAREAPVLVTNRDEPEAVLISVRDLGTDDPDVRLALARTLYDSGSISLGRGARLARLDVESFVAYLAERGIPVLRQRPMELDADLREIEQWRTGSSSTAPG
jgi:prevent-host-death family protein